MLQVIFQTLSVIVALAGVAMAFARWRADQLRKDEVLAWANNVIRAMQAVWLLCSDRISQIDEATRTQRFGELAIETSYLLEQGRLFFRNEKSDYGRQDKEGGYRGLRPEILDHILVAHLISCDWPSASKQERRRMDILARSRVEAFVTLAQKEVGRSRTASPDVGRGGQPISLSALLAKVDTRSTAS